MNREKKTEEFCKETHPNFTITCDKCGSRQVYVDNTMGFSARSGSWGSIDLICNECESKTEIVSS